LSEEFISSDDDEVSQLIADRHDFKAFSPVSSLTVGEAAAGWNPWHLAYHGKRYRGGGTRRNTVFLGPFLRGVAWSDAALA
jgi:hypothetical protein